MIVPHTRSAVLYTPMKFKLSRNVNGFLQSEYLHEALNAITIAVLDPKTEGSGERHMFRKKHD